MNPKISIIIPAYNAQKSIVKSVQSVTNGTIIDYEILVIDDGSNDQTPNIVNTLAKDNNRIRLIKKENGGVSSARNRGILEAKAPYVMFLDSDDTYEPFCCEKAVNLIESENADIVMFGYNECYIKNTIQVLCPVQRLLESQDEIFCSLIEGHYMSGLNGYLGSVCIACFRKDIIIQNNIFFNEKLHHSEDKLFLLNYLFCCNKLAVINETLYNYNLGDSSATKKYSPDLERNHKVYGEEYRTLLKRFGHDISTEQIGQGAVSYVFSIILNEVREGNPKPFLQQMKKVITTSRENRETAKLAIPKSRSLKIKRFIALHPSACILFYLVRRVQRALGVYF